jgi:hypothetical protein
MAGYAVGIIAAVFLQSALILAGCADLKSERAGASQAEDDLLGVWNGMTVNDCSPVQLEPARCSAVERISFTVLRRHKRSWGFYRCAPGTRPCYNQVDRGEIKYLALSGRMLWLRVMRNDHSSCLFDAIPKADRMRGKFWCFQGSALIERGFWQVDRAY